jgi:hypothetical protein
MVETTYAYDAVGNLQNFTCPNGVTAGGPAFEPPKLRQLWVPRPSRTLRRAGTRRSIA